MSGKFIFTCESRDQINEMFYFRQFMNILKFSGKFITIGLMLTYDAYVSLGRIEELLLLENADEVIVLCKGRVLDKGRFTELRDKGVISSTADPLHKAALKDKMGTSEAFFWQDKEEHDDAEKCQKIHPLPNEAKILEIPKEDCTIGVLTSWLYWDYFRSGAHPLMITGMVE